MFELLLTNLKSSPVREVEFLGEQPTSGFIDGAQLASAIGLTAGTAQHDDAGWLHFTLDGKTLYVAKKTYRHSVSWNHINAVGAVFGSKTVVIKGLRYKVRLLKTVATGDMYTGNGSSGWDLLGAYKSEWNRLMYPIHSGNHTDSRNPSLMSGEGIHFGTLRQYTDADLALYHTVGNGAYSWCQESVSGSTGMRVLRGNEGVSHLGWFAASIVLPNFGWRPVLELVQ